MQHYKKKKKIFNMRKAAWIYRMKILKITLSIEIDKFSRGKCVLVFKKRYRLIKTI